MSQTDEEAVPVFVPVESAAVDTEAVLELRPTEQGQTVMLAYSSLEQLVECCGDYQPWIAVYAPQVPELIARSGADGVVWDHPLRAGQRHGPETFEGDDAIRHAIGDDVVREQRRGY